MLLEGFRPQFAKLGPVGKKSLVLWFLHFFHFENIEMDDK